MDGVVQNQPGVDDDVEGEVAEEVVPADAPAPGLDFSLEVEARIELDEHVEEKDADAGVPLPEPDEGLDADLRGELEGDEEEEGADDHDLEEVPEDLPVAGGRENGDLFDEGLY